MFECLNVRMFECLNKINTLPFSLFLFPIPHSLFPVPHKIEVRGGSSSSLFPLNSKLSKPPKPSKPPF